MPIRGGGVHTIAFGEVLNIRILWVPQFSSILSPSYLASWTMADEILTLREVAEYLRLAEKTAYRLAAEGKLPGFKVGGSWPWYC